MENLLALIRKHESSSNYDSISNLVDQGYYPKRPITQMTVNEILDWQESVDSFQRSEAVGAYQVMEDTLRELRDSGRIDGTHVFDGVDQDHVAMLLLERRGLSRLKSGEMNLRDFCNSIAREWASLPVVSDTRGSSRNVLRGQSYYAGDGLNAALCPPDEVENAVRADLADPAKPQKKIIRKKTFRQEYTVRDTRSAEVGIDHGHQAESQSAVTHRESFPTPGHMRNNADARRSCPRGQTRQAIGELRARGSTTIRKAFAAIGLGGVSIAGGGVQAFDLETISPLVDLIRENHWAIFLAFGIYLVFQGIDWIRSRVADHLTGRK